MPEKREIPREWLADPVTKEPPRFGEHVAHCASGDYRYDPGGRFWDFTPPNLAELFADKWPIWSALQENGRVSYANDPEHNLGVGERPDFIEFARFCRFRGNVLDVGCGPQRLPTHFRQGTDPDVFFVGLDPLVGEQPRDFAFVLGMGEFLPFKAGVFDQVLFVTSLDHFLDPVPPLREARRVLAPGGEVCVWIGEKDRGAPRPATSPEWYRRLQVPPGAEDAFHYRRFGSAEFAAYTREAGLSPAEERVIKVDHWRRNIYYRLRPT